MKEHTGQGIAFVIRLQAGITSLTVSKAEKCYTFALSFTLVFCLLN